MSHERGTYGAPLIGGAPGQGGSSIGTWLVGGLLVGGAVLWARHQSDQMAKLYQAAGLPHQSFSESVSVRARELASASRKKIHEFTRDPRPKLETP